MSKVRWSSQNPSSLRPYPESTETLVSILVSIRLPGRPGWLPTQAPHRPVRADFPHTVPQVTGSLRDFRPHGRSSGWEAGSAPEGG